MCTTKPKALRRVDQSGFTLIELIIFIVVVSAGLAGILSVMNTTVKSSADPMLRKQAIAIAESLLEEILLKDYCDPDTVNAGTPPTCAAPTKEASRNLYDDVDDYDGYSTNGGIKDVLGVAVAGLESYNIDPAVTVVAASSTEMPGVDAKKITVSVKRGTDVISLIGYRAKY